MTKPEKESEMEPNLLKILATLQQSNVAMQQLLTMQNERLERLESRQEVSNAPVAVPTNTRLIGELEKRIPRFSFDPETEISFSDWYSRYEDIFLIDGALLDDESRLRLLTEKLDTETYRRFENHILPKTPKQLKFADAVKILKELFEVNVSVFTRQYLCWTSEFDKNSLEDDQAYGDRINERFHRVMSDMDVEALKVLRFLVGLKGQDDQRHLPYLLSYADKMKECEEKVTLQGIIKELKKQRAFRRDGELVANASTPLEVNKVGIEANEQKYKDVECFRCGKRGHFRRECRSELPDCKGCKGTGKDSRYNSPEQAHPHRGKSQHAEGKRRHRIGILAGQQEDGNRTECHGSRMVDLKVNGIPLTFCVDSGSDVTLLNVQSWERMGSPMLRSSNCQLTTVAGDVLSCKGEFDCEFEVDEEKHTGTVYVTDAQNLYGLDWIAKTSKGRQMLDLLGYSKVTRASNYNKSEGKSADLGKKSDKCSKVPELAGTAHRIGYVKALKLQRSNNPKKEGRDRGEKSKSKCKNQSDRSSPGMGSVSQKPKEVAHPFIPKMCTGRSQFRRDVAQERGVKDSPPNGNSSCVGETVWFQRNSAPRKWLKAEVVALKGKNNLMLRLNGEAYRYDERPARGQVELRHKKYREGQFSKVDTKISRLPPLEKKEDLHGRRTMTARRLVDNKRRPLMTPMASP